MPIMWDFCSLSGVPELKAPLRVKPLLYRGSWIPTWHDLLLTSRALPHPHLAQATWAKLQQLREAKASLPAGQRAMLAALPAPPV